MLALHTVGMINQISYENQKQSETATSAKAADPENKNSYNCPSTVVVKIPYKNSCIHIAIRIITEI